MIDFRWATQSAINIHFAYDEFFRMCTFFLIKLISSTEKKHEPKNTLSRLWIQCTLSMRCSNMMAVPCVHICPQPRFYSHAIQKPTDNNDITKETSRRNVIDANAWLQKEKAHEDSAMAGSFVNKRPTCAFKIKSKRINQINFTSNARYFANTREKELHYHRRCHFCRRRRRRRHPQWLMHFSFFVTRLLILILR